MREQGGAILLGREQHEVGEALGHHGRDLNQIIASALDVLLDEFVDGAVQAVGHRALCNLEPYVAATRTRTNEERGCRAQSSTRLDDGDEDARSMLTMIEERVTSSDIRIEHWDALIRLRAMIADDLIALERGQASAPSSHSDLNPLTVEH